MRAEKRRGRKPKIEQARDEIERKAQEIIALANKARTHEDLENAARHLLDLVNRFFKIEKRKSHASEKDIGCAALFILRLCDWSYIPPPVELVEAFELILRLDAGANNRLRAKWRTAVAFAASRPATEDVKAQELSKAVNRHFKGAKKLSWNTAYEWLKDSEFKAEVEEARARREFYHNFRAQRRAQLEALRQATLPGLLEVREPLAVREKPGEVSEKGEHPSGEQTR